MTVEMATEVPDVVYLVLSTTPDVYARVQILRVFETAEETELYKTILTFFHGDNVKSKPVKDMRLAGVLNVALRAKKPTRVVFCEFDGAGQLVDVETLVDPKQGVH